MLNDRNMDSDNLQPDFQTNKNPGPIPKKYNTIRIQFEEQKVRNS